MSIQRGDVRTPSEFAGTTVKIRAGVVDPLQHMVVGGADYQVEDWWLNIARKSWEYCHGNPAAIQYALRIGMSPSVPIDDEVLYGKIDGVGHLVHISEIEPTDAA